MRVYLDILLVLLNSDVNISDAKGTKVKAIVLAERGSKDQAMGKKGGISIWKCRVEESRERNGNYCSMRRQEQLKSYPNPNHRYFPYHF